MKSSSKNVFNYSSEVDLKYDTSGKVDVENDGVVEEDTVSLKAQKDT